MELIRLQSAVIANKSNLAEAIFSMCKKSQVQIQSGDVLVISSKVVALTQGRMVDLEEITPSTRALRMKKSRYGVGTEDPRVVELVLRESEKVYPGNMLLSLKEGILIPAAGIDTSNTKEGTVILWPKNPWGVAKKLWGIFKKQFKVSKLGIVICDSHCQPLRKGTTGIALSWAGFEGVEDARGTKDIFGKKLAVTQKAVADNLCSAAEILMGEADECVPFVVVRGAPVKFTSRQQKSTTALVKPADCIFNGIYKKGI